MNVECAKTVVPLIGHCESLENIVAHQQMARSGNPVWSKNL